MLVRLGGRSSTAELLVVVQVVGGPNPLAHPSMEMSRRRQDRNLTTMLPELRA